MAYISPSIRHEFESLSIDLKNEILSRDVHLEKIQDLMAVLEQISTNIVASPMLMPLIAELVVASVGHMPNSKTKIGFSLMMPLTITFRFLFIF